MPDDTTTVHLVVHACPPRAAPALLDVVTDLDMVAAPTPGPGSDGRRAIRTCTRYSGHATDPVGGDPSVIDSLGERLVRYAADAAWTLWCPPTGGLSGTVRIFIPDRGLYCGNCDGAGRPMLDVDEISDVAHDPNELDKASGGEHLAAIAQLDAAPDVVVAPPVYEMVWHRGTGLCAILTDDRIATVQGWGPYLGDETPAAELTDAGWLLTRPSRDFDPSGTWQAAAVTRVPW